MSLADERAMVVLLHASASSARQWDALSALLQPHFRVCAIDLHGHGARPAWSGAAPFALGDDVALVEPIVAQAGSVHLVGHSYGAAVALKLATLRPHAVRSVVAYEPVLFRWLIDDPARHHHPVQDVLSVVVAMRERVAGGRLDEAARRFIDFWSGAGTWEALPAERQRSIACRAPVFLQQFDALFREPFARAALARCHVPLRFISGARTVAVARRLAELLRAVLPGADHVTLSDMGHLGPVTHAAAVNPLIADFLAQASAPCALPARLRVAA